MTLYLPTSFTSPQHPDHSILYTHLNKNAPHTVLFCYGTNSDSSTLTRFQTFLTTSAKDLSLICIDRWTHGPSASQSGTALFSELSSITIALLLSLNITKLSIVAHSAGVYQMLDLVTALNASQNQTGNGIEIERCFALAPHIPAPYTDSRAMSLMCTMPPPLFSLITKLDSGLPNTAVGKFLINLTGISKTLPREDDGTFVDNVPLRELVEKHEGCLSKEEEERRRKRLDLDYRLGYTRIEGIGMDFLTGLFLNFDLDLKGEGKGGPKLTWFCCEADVFFGPKSVARVKEAMEKEGKVGEGDIEVKVVEGASHADIWLRGEVWRGIWEQIMAES